MAKLLSDIRTAKMIDLLPWHKKIAEKMIHRTHSDFLTRMYKLFGLPEKPKEIPIKIEETKKDIDFEGIFSVRDNSVLEHALTDEAFLREKWDKLGKININIDDQSFMNLYNFCIYLRGLCAHETSHYLHTARNPKSLLWKWSDPSNTDKHLPSRVREFVAELGQMTYMAEKGLLIPHYYEQSTKDSKFPAVYAAFKSDRNLLGKISGMSLIPAIQIIDQYWPRRAG